MELIATFKEEQNTYNLPYPSWVFKMIMDSWAILNEDYPDLKDKGYIYVIIHKKGGTLSDTIYWKVYHMNIISIDYRSVATWPISDTLSMGDIKWYSLKRHMQWNKSQYGYKLNSK